MAKPLFEFGYPGTYGLVSILGSTLSRSFTVLARAQFIKVGWQLLQRTANLWQHVGFCSSIKREPVPCMGHVN